MNTSKQINIMVVLIFLTLVVYGAYTIWEPIRADEAEERQEATAAERGGRLFAQNCRLCHGDRGEGGAAGGRMLQAPLLDRPDLQGIVDSERKLAANVEASDTAITLDEEAAFEEGDILLIDDERMVVKKVDVNLVEVERGAGDTEAAGHSAGAQVFILDEAELKTSAKLIADTITCGRVGTAMTTWGDSQGGSLNDDQIRQLTLLITTGRWNLTEEFVEEADATGIHLEEAVSATDTELLVADVTDFSVGDPLLIGEERMIIEEVKETSLVVERGALTSRAGEHAAGAELLNQALASAPVNPSIVESACGQFVRGPVGTAAPAGTPEAPPEGAQEITITAVPSLQFDTDEIRAEPGVISVRMVNDDTGIPHNFAVYTDSSAAEPIAGANEKICTGPCEAVVTFEINETGTFFFRCDVHPTIMVGDFIIE